MCKNYYINVNVNGRDERNTVSTLQGLKVKLLGGGIFQTILRTSFNNFLVLILTTLTSILTARVFGAQGRGELQAILMWPTILVGFIGFGLSSSLIYNARNKFAGTSGLLKLALTVQLPAAVAAGGAAWYFLPMWLSEYPHEVVLLARTYCLLAIPLAVAVNMLIAFAQSVDRFDTANGILLFMPLLNLVGYTTLWFGSFLHLGAAVVINFLSGTMVVLWAFYKLRDQVSFKRAGKVTKDIRKLFYTYGLKVYGMELIGTLSYHIDKVAIVFLLSPRDLGLYTVVYSLSRLFNTVQNAIAGVLFPKVTGMPKDTILSTVSRAFRISMLILLIAFIPSVWIGQFMLGLLFGPEFLESSYTFYLLCLECIIVGGAKILSSSFNALGRPALALYRQIASIVVTTILFFVLAPLLGLIGIALAMLTGALVRLIVTLISFPAFFGYPLHRVLYDRKDLDYVLQIIRRKKVSARNKSL